MIEMEAYVHDAVLDMYHARDELEAALDEVMDGDWERRIPYATRTLHELLAHLAGADQAWALAAQGLLKGESEGTHVLSPEEARAARARAVDRGRGRPVAVLREEMGRRRKLLLELLELLEPRHLALALKSYGDEHNSVRERIWLGYHDRLHAADVRRALRLRWYPPKLEFLPELREAAAALSPDGALYVIYSVDPTRWEMPSMLPGWSNRNLLAHISTGDWVFQYRLHGLIADGTVPPHVDVDAGNRERVDERKYTTVNALIEEFLSMRHETMLLLSRLGSKHLRVKMEFPWLPRPNEHTVLDYVAGFWQHDKYHTGQLRPAMKFETARK
jgi:uncharacterized damage-inducible protein DinB